MKTFNVGDKVRVISSVGEYKAGLRGKIIDIDHVYSVRWPYRAEFEGIGSCLFQASELEKIEMAKLTCSDGTVINISAETEKELRKAFETPKYYKVGQCFSRSGIRENVMLVRGGNIDMYALVLIEGMDKGKDVNGWRVCKRNPSNYSEILASDVENLTIYKITPLD